MSEHEAEPEPPAEENDTRRILPADWGIAEIGLGILYALGLVLVGTIAVGVFDPELESDAALAGAQAAFALGLIGAALLVAGRTPGPRLERLGLGGISGRTVKIALAGWGVYLLLAAAIAPLLQPEQDEIARQLDDVAGTIAIIVAGLLIVVAAPLSEEIFFRGFVFAGLRNSVPFWAAALVSAAFWGALHLTGGNIGVVVQLTVFGVVLAYLYERSGSLWAPMIAHAINNGIAYTLLVTDVI